MPRHRFTERYSLPSSGVSGAQQAMQMAEQQRRTMSGSRMIDPLVDQARQAQIDRANASEAKAQYELSKQIETDRQRTAFYNGLNELETHLNNNGAPIGTRQHAEAFSAYAHEFPLARSSTDVQNALKIHALVNDDQAALKQRMLELSPPPEKIAQRYAKVQGDIATFSSDPNKSADLNGALIESDQIEKAYPQLKVPSLPTQVITPTEDGTTPPTTQPDVTAPQTTTPVAAQTPAVDHSAALNWANSNPNDPRAQVIIQRAQAAMPQTTPPPDEGQ
jgi:hypothetical protein